LKNLTSTPADAIIEQVARRIIHIPFPKNHQFVGRWAELETLHQKLFTTRDCQTMAVIGLGGIGKTQVVLEFAYTVSERYATASVFWTPALSVETFVRAMEEIAGRLGISVEKSDDVRLLVKRRLEAPQAGRWLLIVDNADDIDIVDGLLPFLPRSNTGAVVFTTRAGEVAHAVARGDVIRLQNPSKDEALEILKRALWQAEDCEGAVELLGKLEYLPLAITQAAGYLNVNNMPIPEYLQLLCSTDKDDVVFVMSREVRDSMRYRQAASAVATTWILSFRQILKQDPIAADLLQFMSCIEWKAIPYSLLPPTKPEARGKTAIGTLCSYSFLTRCTDGKTYDLHRLVHLACQIWVRENGRLSHVQADAIEHVAQIFPVGDWKEQETWRAYMLHAVHLRSQWSALDTANEVDREGDWWKSELCLRVGKCLFEDFRIEDAIQWLQKSCDLDSALPTHDQHRLLAQHSLALAYFENRQFEESVQLLEHVIAIEEQTLSGEDPSTFESQHALAMAYSSNGQSKEAIQLLERISRIEAKTLEDEHPSRLKSQHALAVAYHSNGQIDKAIQKYEEAVFIQTRTLSEEDPTRLGSQFMLAMAYFNNEQIKEAIQILEQVFAVEERVLRDDHPGFLRTMHGLAAVYKQDGQLEKAIQLLERVVQIAQRPEVEYLERSNARAFLANMYGINGQVEEARMLREDAETADQPLGE
jgi:tetratricopeptide (TPR) repeat protein